MTLIHRMMGDEKDWSPKERCWLVVLHLLVWYILSAAVQFYNKWFFTGATSLPVFICSIYHFIHLLLAYLVLSHHPQYLPTKSLKGQEYWINVVPTGLLVGLEMTLSTMAIPDLTVIFYIVVRCTVPIFAIFFLWIMNFIKMNSPMLLVLFFIATGILQTVLGEAHLNTDAYMMVQMSAVVSGVRLALVQLLLSDPELGISNALTTLYLLAPWSCVSLLIASICHYGIPSIMNLFLLQSPIHLLGHVLGIVGGGCFTFLVQIMLFRVIIVTDAVTFATASVFKDAFAVCLSSLVLGEAFQNVTGFGLILAGMLLYNFMKLYSQESALIPLDDKKVIFEVSEVDMLLNVEQKIYLPSSSEETLAE